MTARSKTSTRSPGQKTPVAASTKIATTSPYFSVHPHTLPAKRKANDELEDSGVAHSTPKKLSNTRKQVRLTTSPYFAPTTTPTKTLEAQLEIEAEEEKKREKKRRRLVVRGDTPPTYVPPPPSSPEALSEAMRQIKPELVQEKVRDNPWKIMVATTMLNKTSGKVALPVYWEVLERWPTPLALAQASAPMLTDMLRTVGTQSVRTQRLMRLSNAYTMHPPKLPPPAQTETTPSTPVQSFFVSAQTTQPTFKPPRHYTSKEYKAIQKTSAVAHIPFAGPYAIDSFGIFSSHLRGEGAPSGVDRQLDKIGGMPRKRQAERDDFDETPEWYEPHLLNVEGDDDAEWRQVRPEDKQLRRYLVWRWAIEGVAYHPEEGHKFEPANWLYLNHLIRS